MPRKAIPRKPAGRQLLTLSYLTALCKIPSTQVSLIEPGTIRTDGVCELPEELENHPQSVGFFYTTLKFDLNNSDN